MYVLGVGVAKFVYLNLYVTEYVVVSDLFMVRNV